MPPTAYIVMTNIPSQEWIGAIQKKRQVLGRGEDVELRVPAQYVHVSRRHAEIWVDSEGYWISDLDSTTGSRVNGVPLTPTQSFRLMLGDHIWVGAAEFDFVANPELSRRRPFPKPEDKTIGFGGGPNATVRFVGAPAHFFAMLTQAELEVLLWMSRGFTDLDDVAQKVHRSPHTIRTHLGNIFNKLGVHSRDELLSCLLRRIIASPDS